MNRWKLYETTWVTGEDWYMVVDSKHEHNTYETKDKAIALAFKQMMEALE